MMDGTDREILNFIQREFPLEREPFSAIGREVGVAGNEVIRRIESLKRGKVIRQISAIFTPACSDTSRPWWRPRSPRRS